MMRVLTPEFPGRYAELYITPHTTCRDVLAQCRVPFDQFELVEVWHDIERSIGEEELVSDTLQQWGPSISQVSFVIKRRQDGEAEAPVDNRPPQGQRIPQLSSNKLPGGVEVTLADLRQMSGWQASMLHSQQQKLKQQQLQQLKERQRSSDPYQNAGVLLPSRTLPTPVPRQNPEALKQQQLRAQEMNERSIAANIDQLNYLRQQFELSKSVGDSNQAGNSFGQQENDLLSSELDSVRSLFSEKEKELSNAVAKVEELTAQLEMLKTSQAVSGVQGSNPSGADFASSNQFDRLNSQLLLRNMMNSEQSANLQARQSYLQHRSSELDSLHTKMQALNDRIHSIRTEQGSAARAPPLANFSHQYTDYEGAPGNFYSSSSSISTINAPISGQKLRKTPPLVAQVSPMRIQRDENSSSENVQNSSPNFPIKSLQSYPAKPQDNSLASIEYRPHKYSEVPSQTQPYRQINSNSVPSRESDSDVASSTEMKYSSHIDTLQRKDGSPRSSQVNRSPRESSNFLKNQKYPEKRFSDDLSNAYSVERLDPLDFASGIDIQARSGNSVSSSLNSVEYQRLAATKDHRASPVPNLNPRRRSESPLATNVPSRRLSGQNNSIQNVARDANKPRMSFETPIGFQNRQNSKQTDEELPEIHPYPILEQFRPTPGTQIQPPEEDDPAKREQSGSLRPGSSMGEKMSSSAYERLFPPKLASTDEVGELDGIARGSVDKSGMHHLRPRRSSLTNNEEPSPPAASPPEDTYVAMYPPATGSNPQPQKPQGILKKSPPDSYNKGLHVFFDALALFLDAALEGDITLVQDLFSQLPNPSAGNDEGITALHNAICAGHTNIVHFLVQNGCDINAADSDGWTPLHCAASCNNLLMVKYLVENGACIFARTLSDPETPAEKCEEDIDNYVSCSQYLYGVQEKLGIMNRGVVYALYDYSAVNPDELSFSEGDALVVLRRGDENEVEWWWSRDRHSSEGYVPRNLVGLFPRVRIPSSSQQRLSQL